PQKFNMSTGYKKDKFSATVAGQIDRSNGNRAGSEFWLANEYVHLQYAVSDNWQIGTNVDMTQSKANNPGTIQNPLESMWTKIFRGTASVFANNRYDKVRGGIQAYANWGRHQIDDGHAPGADPRTYLFNSVDRNMGITVFETYTPVSGTDVHLGLDFQHWGGRSWNTDKADPEKESGHFKGSENEIAGYVMVQQNLFADHVGVNAGVRLQHGSQYGNIWVPQAGIVWHPVPTADIKFSFGKGFRSPNLRELYLYQPANPDLKPEYMYNYELSYSQWFASNHLRLGASLYYINGRDMIQTMNVDGRPKNMNVGRFINKGFELEGSWFINTRWNVSANYAYLHTDNTVIYAPKNKLGAEVNFTPGNFAFTLEE
ncbi:MAG: TonB-dependent receptor, partial [Muribaculaceae bacterium]|nr:TonB-dependent receptor [Muribaculaceae bacterium]